MFDVEQFEWRGIDQATRWYFELTKSKPGYAVHHNTRSLDIHTQNTYSSAPSRGSSCEPNYYQNRYKQHPKYGSCGLTLQIKRFRIESKNLIINRNNVTVVILGTGNPNFLPTHVTNIHTPSLPQLKFPCPRRIARCFSFPPRVRIKWIRLDLLKTQMWVSLTFTKCSCKRTMQKCNMQILTHLDASHWATKLKLPFLLDTLAFTTGVSALVAGASADTRGREQFLTKEDRQV